MKAKNTEKGDKMKKKIAEIKLITRLFLALGAAAVLSLTTGCAGMMVDDARRFTDADYNRQAEIDINNAWYAETEEPKAEPEPSIFSNDWCMKYRAGIKLVTVSLFCAPAIGSDSAGKEIYLPLSALCAYGIASIPVDWNKEKDSYKWPVVGGAAAGLAAGIAVVVQNKLYESQYGWEGIISFGTAFIATCLGTGVGGIIGDIAGAFDKSVTGKKI
jgi:hypothetical protein